MSAGAVDALAVLVKLCSFGGTFEARRVCLEFNTARSTGTIRSHLRPATSAQVRAALRKAERAGDVESCANPAPSWRASAADRAELFWRLTPSAFARTAAAQEARRHD